MQPETADCLDQREMLFQWGHPEFQISGCFLPHIHLPSTYRDPFPFLPVDLVFQVPPLSGSRKVQSSNILGGTAAISKASWVEELQGRSLKIEASDAEEMPGNFPSRCPLCSPPPQGAALGLSGNGGSLTMWPRAPSSSGSLPKTQLYPPKAQRRSTV